MLETINCYIAVFSSDSQREIFLHYSLCLCISSQLRPKPSHWIFLIRIKANIEPHVCVCEGVAMWALLDNKGVQRVLLPWMNILRIPNTCYHAISSDYELCGGVSTKLTGARARLYFLQSRLPIREMRHRIASKKLETARQFRFGIAIFLVQWIAYQFHNHPT